MIAVSKSIVLQRWDMLPDNLREGLSSEENSSFLERLAKSENLPANKFKIFSKLAGYVMLGFIHPDDLGKELQDNLHVPFQTAKNIETALKEKVFNLYSEDLQKIYSPPVAEKGLSSVPGSLTEGPRGIPRPVLLKETPGPTILRKEEVFIKSSVPLPASQGIPKPIPRPQNALIPRPAGAVPPKSPVLSPFTFEKEERPLAPPSGFRLGGVPRPSMANTAKPPTPPRPARVELGGEEIKKPAAPESKIVGREPIHYSEPKSVFMPQMGTPKPPLAATPPFPPPQSRKIEVPLPSFPRPTPQNQPNAIPNPAIH